MVGVGVVGPYAAFEGGGGEVGELKLDEIVGGDFDGDGWIGVWRGGVSLYIFERRGEEGVCL